MIIRAFLISFLFCICSSFHIRRLSRIDGPSKFIMEKYAEGSGYISKLPLADESWSETFSLFTELLSIKLSAASILDICGRCEAVPRESRAYFLLRWKRDSLLTDFLGADYPGYVELVNKLGNRIPRVELPNVQDIKIPEITVDTTEQVQLLEVIPDCTLPNKTFADSPLDNFLLSIFRDLVRKEIQWKSNTPGIKGLLEEGRHYMLSEQGTAENQHAFVKKTLAGLMTPFLPPFYRIFMSGIIPCEKNNDPEWLIKIFDYCRNKLPESLQSNLSPGKQLGPWFYAPFLTSFVTPVFLSFLVGPSRVNRRKNGQLGGLVIEKCKFLQESGCKGLCLHQCKIPAQEFFAETLGLPLTVTPNFATQECQWSWGDIPPPVELDASFPKGCLAGCPTRQIMAGKEAAWTSGNPLEGAAEVSKLSYLSSCNK